MKKTILAIAAVALLMVGTQAFGEICATDNVPAATLLIPYFSVNSACDPTGATTFFTITNASAAPIVAHVTVWTDWSVPEIDFDIYLTGYDVQSFDMWNVFCDNPNSPEPGGDLPSTYWGKPPGDGPYSIGIAASPANCGTVDGDPPNYGPGAIVPVFQDHLRAMFTGQAGADGNCGGTVGDGSFHGYVTIDANAHCSVNFPDQPVYWTGTETIQDETANVLMGDYQYLDVGGRTSEGFTMVHIEAFAEIAAGPGPSFYGRYAPPATDGREPLPVTWGGRYNANGAVDSTFFQIWRTGAGVSTEGTCGSDPHATCNLVDQCPGLDVNFALAFNNDEEVVVTTGGPSGGPAQAEICINLETQNLDVYNDLLSGFNNGWYYLNLDATCTDGQSYLTITQELDVAGVFSGGWDGVALLTGCSQFLAAPPTSAVSPTYANPVLQP